MVVLFGIYHNFHLKKRKQKEIVVREQLTNKDIESGEGTETVFLPERQEQNPPAWQAESRA